MVVDLFVVIGGCLIAQGIFRLVTWMFTKENVKTYTFMVFPRGWPKFWRVIDDDSVEQLQEIMKQYDEYSDRI